MKDVICTLISSLSDILTVGLKLFLGIIIVLGIMTFMVSCNLFCCVLA